MQTQRDPNQNSPRRRYSPGALGLPLLAGLAGLAGLLMLTGCIRVEISGFDPFNSSSPGTLERVRLSLSEVNLPAPGAIT